MTARISGEGWSDVVFGAGALEEGATGRVVHRLPAWARTQVDDALFGYAEACPGGVSIRFTTSADAAHLTIAAHTVAVHGEDAAPLLLVVRQAGRDRTVALTSPTIAFLGPGNHITDVRTGSVETVRLPVEGDGPVEVFLPHNARIELVSLESTEPLLVSPPSGVRWTHYGSSISQGLDAADATRTWPATAATRLDWRLRNLAFAGNAQLDGFAARVIRDTPADIISVKVGINLVNADSMRERAFRPAVHAFLDTIREGQPTTPIVLISAVACPIHEASPGPVMTGDDGSARVAARTVEDDTGALTLSRTRAILADVVQTREDDRLVLLDGRELFGDDDVRLLSDGLHPDQAGLDLIAERFVDRVPHLLEALGVDPSDLQRAAPSIGTSIPTIIARHTT